MNVTRRAGRSAGFTLIELLVVIAIIGLLSAIVLASLNTARMRSRDARRASDLHSVVQAMALYASDNGGTFPKAPVGGDNNCAGAASCLGDVTSALVGGKYIPSMPEDPLAKYADTVNNYRYCIPPASGCTAGALHCYQIIRRRESDNTWCTVQSPALPAGISCWMKNGAPFDKTNTGPAWGGFC